MNSVAARSVSDRGHAPDPHQTMCRRLVDLDQRSARAPVGLRNCSCRWRQLSARYGAAAEAARDGQEIRRVDVDADLRDAALGHVLLDLAIAAVVPEQDRHREFQLDRSRQLRRW